MGLWKRMKKSYQKFLLELAEENKKSFGEGKLDCCQLNKNSAANTKTK